MLILVVVTINVALNGNLFGKAEKATRETEIKIGSSKSDIDEDFEKYIMGADLTGRSIMEICDFSSFIDDPLTADVDETETLGVELLTTGQNEDMTKGFIYAKYDNKAYKIICDVTTFKSEKLEMIYEPKGTEGQTTAEGWTILYDNGDSVEAVAPFTSDGTLTLGSNNVGDAVESYNNAITSINDYVKAETTTYDTGKKITEYTQDGTTKGVRSVGSASETSDAPDNKYRSDNLETWNSAYNGVGKKGDILFEQDLIRMAYWGESSIGTSYWMASRVVNEYSDNVDFRVNFVREDGNLNRNYLWYVYSSGNANGSTPSYAVRPIITIENL